MRELVYTIAASIERLHRRRRTLRCVPLEGDHSPTVLRRVLRRAPVHALDALGIRPPCRLRHGDHGVEHPATGAPQPVTRTSARSPRAAMRAITTPRSPSRTIPAARWSASSANPDETSGCAAGRSRGALLPWIDRLVIKRNPVVFGSGVPLFGGGTGAVRAFERVSLSHSTRASSSRSGRSRRRAEVAACRCRYADPVSSPRLPRDRGRTASIVLSSISLSVLTFVLLWTFALDASVSGASSMALILPMVVFWARRGAAGSPASSLSVSAPRPHARRSPSSSPSECSSRSSWGYS